MNNIINLAQHQASKKYFTKQLPKKIDLKTRYPISFKWLIKKNLKFFIALPFIYIIYSFLNYLTSYYLNYSNPELEKFIHRNILIVLSGIGFFLIVRNLSAYMRLKNFEYQIENGRLKIKKGIVKKMEFYIPLLPITEVIIQRDFLDQVLGTSDLEVYTQGSQKKTNIRIPSLTLLNAEKLKQVLFYYCEHSLDENQKKHLFSQMTATR